MATLTTTPNIADPDGLYAELIAAQDGLSDDESAAFTARLVLLLANHVGDREVIRQALTAAANAGRKTEENPK